MDPPLPCLARVDIVPPKTNYNGRVLPKPQRKPWLTRALKEEINTKHNEESGALPLLLFYLNAPFKTFPF
jgi:hypothetical protein